MRPTVCLSVLLALTTLNNGAFAAHTNRSAPTPLGPQNAQNAAISSPGQETHSPSSDEFVIPGPRRSFLRMAGISQKVASGEVLPLLSRNVFTQGYQGTTQPTEFLILLRRYVVQARELASLAEKTGAVLRVSNCEDAGPLLRILGYRVRPDCGQASTSLQTEDPERAFLAIDSGFPLTTLEQALQGGGKQFEYPYSSEAVPVLFRESDWTQLSRKNLRENSRDLLDTILNDSSIARLYWALSRMDGDTSEWMAHSIGLPKLLP